MQVLHESHGLGTCRMGATDWASAGWEPRTGHVQGSENEPSGRPKISSPRGKMSRVIFKKITLHAKFISNVGRIKVIHYN